MKKLLEKGFKGLMLIAAVAAGLSIGLFLCERDVKADSISANSVSVLLNRIDGGSTYYDTGYKVDIQFVGCPASVSGNRVIGIESVKFETNSNELFTYTVGNNISVTVPDAGGTVSANVISKIINDVDFINSAYNHLSDTIIDSSTHEIKNIKAIITFSSDSNVFIGTGATTPTASTDASMSSTVNSLPINHVTFTPLTGLKSNGTAFDAEASIKTTGKYNITPKYSGSSGWTTYPETKEVYCYNLGTPATEGGTAETNTLYVESTDHGNYYENCNKTGTEVGRISDEHWGISGTGMCFSVSGSVNHNIYYLPVVGTFYTNLPSDNSTIYMDDSTNTTGHFDFKATAIAKNSTEDNNKIIKDYLFNHSIQPAAISGLTFSEGSLSTSADATSATYTKKINITSPGLTADVPIVVKAHLKSSNGGSLAAITSDYSPIPQIPITISPYDEVNPGNTKTKWQNTGNGFITVGQTGELYDLYPIYGASLTRPLAKSKVDVVWALTTGSDKYLTLTNSSGSIKGKEEGTAKLTAKAKIAGRTPVPGYTNITDAEVSIDVYPEPSIKYTSGSGSSRKLEVTMPRKIGYKGLNSGDNFDDIKGFKLELLNSSKDVIAEYDLDKYKDVASGSDKTFKYTISGSDLEELVNKASSNGKFSSESQDVYFRVTPAGKQIKDSSKVVQATDFRKLTDAIKVYQVSASGENMETSTAYGLADQEVKLTATPKSGYSFSKWSDGSTTNPRTIKVSSSTGSNKYTAVAGARADEAGSGGSNLAGYDDVPKTSESNSAIWLIILMVFAVIGGGYALYIQFKPSDEE